MNFTTANLYLKKSYSKIRKLHSEKGHSYIQTHWNRYVNILTQLPPLTSDSKVLEIGASILSAHIHMQSGCSTTVIHHELEPEWKLRCDNLGIESFPVELMRDPLPVENNQYDLILFNEVMEHFPLHPAFFLHQVFQKLKTGGVLFFSVPNFATSEKRLQFLSGQNPQDPMDSTFIYYAHHREPVMQECTTLLQQCGGTIRSCTWLDLDDNPEIFPTIKRYIFHMYRRRFHPFLHLFFPSMRKYIVIKAGRNGNFTFDPALGTPPLSFSREFGLKS